MSTEYAGIKLIDLSEDHIYSGPLSRIIFGQFRGDHVIVDLSDFCAHIFIGEREYYYIDLEKIQTSAQMLDWIMQVASKTWANPQAVGLLVLALNESFYPQSCLCSFGSNGKIQMHTIKKHVEAQLRRLIGWHQFSPNRQLTQADFSWE